MERGASGVDLSAFQDGSESGGNPESVFTSDEVLDDTMLHGLPNTGASSTRLDWEGMQEMMKGGMPSAPISMFPGEQTRLSPRWAERSTQRTNFKELEHGGHFAGTAQRIGRSQGLR
jgi:microsomal epoxide hydrolase